MSGIVGSSHNIRGSGVVAKLGTDGQIFTSAGAGVSQTFEAAAGGGKIGQVLTVTNTDVEETDSNGTYVEISDFSVDITPVATSSKIWIVSTLALGVYDNQHSQLMRDSTAIAEGDAEGNRVQESFSSSGTAMQYSAWPMTYTWLDSPSSTSAITYSWQWQANGQTRYMNRSWYDNNTADYGRAASSMTVMEVLA